MSVCAYYDQHKITKMTLEFGSKGLFPCNHED